jgi:hypothetical protein
MKNDEASPSEELLERVRQVDAHNDWIRKHGPIWHDGRAYPPSTFGCGLAQVWWNGQLLTKPVGRLPQVSGNADGYGEPCETGG